MTLIETLFQFAGDLEALGLKANRPRLRDAGWRRDVADACTELAERAQATRATLSEGYEALAPSLEDAARCIHAYAAELALDSTTPARLRAKAVPLSQVYEDLRRRLKGFPGAGTFIHAPRLERMKPTNYRRNLFHVGMGLMGAFIYEFLLTRNQAIVLLVVLLSVAVGFEVSRRIFPAWNRILMKYIFRDVVRPWEHRRPNSASWYTLALLIITVLTPKLAAQIGLLVLAFGDPAASIIGRKWGKLKLYRRKSLVGTLAFVVAAALVTAGMAMLKDAPLSPAALFGMALTVAAAAAAAELFSDTVDDNASVPVTAACIAALWLAV